MLLAYNQLLLSSHCRPIVEYSDDSIKKTLTRVFVVFFFTSLKIQPTSYPHYDMIPDVSRCNISKAFTCRYLLQNMSLCLPEDFPWVWKHARFLKCIINIFQAKLRIPQKDVTLIHILKIGDINLNGVELTYKTVAF